MSRALKCDRCGSYYQLDISNKEDNFAAMALIDSYNMRTDVRYDLCRECRSELNEWLAKGGNEENNVVVDRTNA